MAARAPLHPPALESFRPVAYGRQRVPRTDSFAPITPTRPGVCHLTFSPIRQALVPEVADQRNRSYNKEISVEGNSVNLALILKSRPWATLVATALIITCIASVGTAASDALSASRLLDRPLISSDLQVNHDLFLKPNLSVGEASLVTRDPVQMWRAAQTRLWVDLPNSETSNKLFLQSGLGFLERDPLLQLQSSLAPPSVVIPLGVGMEYALRSKHSLTTMFSLDVSESRSGLGASTQIAPGLSFGLRF